MKERPVQVSSNIVERQWSLASSTSSSHRHRHLFTATPTPAPDSADTRENSFPAIFIGRKGYGTRLSKVPPLPIFYSFLGDNFKRLLHSISSKFANYIVLGWMLFFFLLRSMKSKYLKCVGNSILHVAQDSWFVEFHSSAKFDQKLPYFVIPWLYLLMMLRLWV